VRVVPNKYPVVDGSEGRSEVVVHSPRHELSIAGLLPDELADVAAAWRARADAAREEQFGYVHALINEGRPAGGSLPHTHSQLVWLRDVPPTVAEEQRAGTAFTELLERERREEVRVVAERDGIVAICPYASRAPYELVVAPVEPEADAFSSPLLGPGLALLAAAVERLLEAEGSVPLNAWLHTSRLGSATGHWHLELVPRLTVAAGLELGAGIYVNPLPPERAAETLRHPPDR
jgi:UDPglucose--hexose-1-phosphate uridylyltransferase